MKGIISLGALAVALSASSAMAAPMISFAAGSGTVAPGTVIFEDFDGVAANTPIGVNAYALDANSGIGARPAFGSAGNYGSILGGGAYAVSFGPTSIFSFVLGSLDTYNALTLHFADATSMTYNGSAIIGATPPPYPDGNQTASATNGVVTYHVGGGAKIVGATFNSSGNSFEVDNLAAAPAVPEPAAWAMMILGMGAIGSVLRRSRRVTVAFA